VSDPEKLGKYVVEGVLGKGAMGIVYKARDPHIERTECAKARSEPRDSTWTYGERRPRTRQSNRGAQ